MNFNFEEITSQFNNPDSTIDIRTCPCVCNQLYPPVATITGGIKDIEKIFSDSRFAAVQFNAVAWVVVQQRF